MKKQVTITLATCMAVLLLISNGGTCHPLFQKEKVMESQQQHLSQESDRTMADYATQSTPTASLDSQGVAIPAESGQPASTVEEKSADQSTQAQADASEPADHAAEASQNVQAQGEATRAAEQVVVEPTPVEPSLVVDDPLFDEIVLFSTTENEPYVALKVGSRVITAPTDSLEFEVLVAGAFYRKDGTIPSKKVLKETIHSYRYLALLSPNKFPIQTRCAMLRNAIYIDLGDATGDRVKITAEDWKIESGLLAPPFFRRPGGMLPLPRPERGGTIQTLAKFLNLHSRNQDDFKLLFGWLVDALFPGGPYTMLVLNGPQGSAKSTTLRILRDLIDPAEAAMPSLPKSERDLFIAGSKMHLLSYDNVSELKDKLSDAFCRMINHGTYRTRKLYTNLDEIIIKLRRPVIFNGISHFVRQNDFMDRAIFIELPTIHESQRRIEGNLLADWEQARPQVLGALYDRIVVALRNLETVKLPKLPRMADSARWITAAESDGFWESGSFLEEYQGNRSGIVDLTLESDPIAVAVSRLLVGQSNWRGSSTELLRALKAVATDDLQKQKDWPKAPVVLSNRLMRLEGFLTAKGINIERRRTPDKRLIILRKLDGQPVDEVQESATAPEAMEMVA